jgi:hypothetical protein
MPEDYNGGTFGNETPNGGDPGSEGEWGGYTSKEEMLRALKESQNKLSEQGTEIGNLRKLSQYQQELLTRIPIQPQPQQPSFQSVPDSTPQEFGRSVDPLTEPEKWSQNLEQRITQKVLGQVQVANQQLQNNTVSTVNLLQEFRDNFPDLVPYSDLVGYIGMAANMESMRIQGRPLTQVEIMQAGINGTQNFLTKARQSQGSGKPTPTPRAGSAAGRDNIPVSAAGPAFLDEGMRHAALNDFLKEVHDDRPRE